VYGPSDITIPSASAIFSNLFIVAVHPQFFPPSHPIVSTLIGFRAFDHVELVVLALQQSPWTDSYLSQRSRPYPFTYLLCFIEWDFLCPLSLQNLHVKPFRQHTPRRVPSLSSVHVAHQLPFLPVTRNQRQSKKQSIAPAASFFFLFKCILSLFTVHFPLARTLQSDGNLRPQAYLVPGTLFFP